MRYFEGGYVWDGMNYVRTGPHKHAPLWVGAVVQQTRSSGPPAAAISAYLQICAICGAEVHFSGQHDAARYVCVCVRAGYSWTLSRFRVGFI